MTEILEAAMLVCFGLSWPINVAKNIRSRSTQNMSLKFTFLIMAGYVAGIAAKLYLHLFNYVLAVYVLNLLVVSANVAVYVVNRRYELSAAKAEKAESSLPAHKKAV